MKKLFPGFVPNTILRFSSLLGPPKISIGAKIWAGAKRPQKKPQVERGEGGGWKLDFGPTPPPDMLLDDDEVCCYWNSARIPYLQFVSEYFLSSETLSLNGRFQVWQYC